MTKRDNTVRLTDRYQLADLEPGVDPEKAAAFLVGDVSRPSSTTPRPRRRPQRTENVENRTPVTTPGETTAPSVSPMQSVEPWTSRTIRLRQSTATALTKAACSQKSKQAEGKLKPGQPVTVQDIADLGIRLALAELGYSK